MSELTIRASSYHRAVLCPASVKMEAGLPDVTSEDAAEGTLLHEAMSGKEVELTDDQKDLIKYTRKLESDLVGSIDLTLNLYGDELFIEKGRLSGHIDTLYGNDDNILVIDYKFGRNAVDKAESNHQLRAYALLVKHLYTGKQKIFVAVIQPRLPKDQQVTVAKYDDEKLSFAQIEFDATCKLIELPEPVFNPSYEACLYCKAKSICKSAWKESLSLTVNSTEAIQHVSNEDLGKFLDKAAMAEKIFDACRDEARKRLEAGEPIQGWTLSEGRQTRVITDPQKAYNSLGKLISSSEFVECCNVSVSKLEALYKAKTGLKGLQAKRDFDAVMSDSIEIKTSKKVLERAK